MVMSGYARSTFAAATLGVSLALSSPAPAQEFPTKTITIIVPFAAGGAGDILARIVGPRLEKKWGQSVVVEHRPGAGGVVGAVAAARAPADGHTLIIAPSPTMAVNVTLFKKLPYDPAADFTPLALAAATPFVLVVNPQLPVKSVKEFIAYAKAQPQPLNYATSGPGVPHHLFMELLKSMTGLQMTAVPYKGSLPALNDVVAGHVPDDVRRSRPGARARCRAGACARSACPWRRACAAIPDVPPINDDLPGFDVSSWQMFAVPSGTPRAVSEKLHAELNAILAAPDVRAQITKAGMLPMDTRSIAQLESSCARRSRAGATWSARPASKAPCKNSWSPLRLRAAAGLRQAVDNRRALA